jgi:hypothetical protein
LLALSSIKDEYFFTCVFVYMREKGGAHGRGDKEGEGGRTGGPGWWEGGREESLRKVVIYEGVI